jgi:SAM-dependent methyltransferase
VQSATSSPTTQPPQLLHLGCGLTAPQEWLNVDGSLNAWMAQRPLLKKLAVTLRLVPRSQAEIPWPTNVKIADLRKRLPFEAGSFDAVYASHLLEHLHRQEALALLTEVRRVLKPGGVCRMLVPDLRAIVQEYLGERALEGETGAEDDKARQFCRRLLMRKEAPPRGGVVYRAYTALTDFHDHKWMYDGASLVKIMIEGGFVECRERGLHDSEIPHIDKVESPGRVLNGAGVIAEGRRPASA